MRPYQTAHHQEQTVFGSLTPGFSPAVADVSKSVGPLKVVGYNALVAVVTMKMIVAVKMRRFEVDLWMLKWDFVVVVSGIGSVVIEDLFVV